ncbi:MAG: hypothetical protein DI591_08090 [Citromicrobium sp.]|nr:MAG: hypothetical protein DI591_08090 [Citromicrobium sp.]
MDRMPISPTAPPAPALSQLKHWLAIRSPDEDAPLAALIAAALEACEAFTGLVPLIAEYEALLPASGAWQRVPARPVHAITGVEAIPAEGAQRVLAGEAYEIELDADGSGRVRLLRQGDAGRIAVRFTAGLAGEWAALPASLAHGIIRHAAALYRQRDAGEDSPAPAPAIAALWRPYRQVRL